MAISYFGTRPSQLAAILFAICCAVGSGAQVLAAEPTILHTLFLEADSTNPDIRAATESIEIEKARRRQLVLSPIQFDANARIEPDAPKGLGILRSQNATISQQFAPRIVRDASRIASDAAIGASKANVAVVTRAVRLRLVTTYYGLAGAQANRRTAEDSLALAKSFERTARLRERAGDIGTFDLRRASSEVSRSESELQRALGAEIAARIAVNVLAGRLPNESMTASFDLESPSTSTDGLAVAASSAVDPQSVQIDAIIQEYVARSRAVAGQNHPTFSVLAGVQTASVFPTGATSFGPLLGATLSVPIGDRGSIRGAVDEVNGLRRVAEAQLASRNVTRRAEVATALAAVVASESRLRFARESRLQSESILQTALFGYRSGALNVLDVLSSRASVSIAKNFENDARTDFSIAIATLRLLGASL